MGTVEGSEVAEEEEEALMLVPLKLELEGDEGCWDVTREVELTVKGTGYPLPL